MSYTEGIAGEKLKDYMEVLNLRDCENHNAPICDGWRLSASGYVHGRYYKRRYVLGLMDGGPAVDLADRFSVILNGVLEQYLTSE